MPFSSWDPDCFEHYIQDCLVERSDGTCTLAIDTEVEARWYIDAGRWAMGEGRFDHSKVQCPVTFAVGDRVAGPLNFLAAEGIKQAPRFPKALKVWVIWDPLKTPAGLQRWHCRRFLLVKTVGLGLLCLPPRQYL